MSNAGQERFQLAEELFHQALDLRAEERGAKLAEWCAADPSLRAEVESLIDAFRDQELETGTADRDPPPGDAGEDPWIGRQLGTIESNASWAERYGRRLSRLAHTR